jgi:hypothetical protein
VSCQNRNSSQDKTKVVLISRYVRGGGVNCWRELIVESNLSPARCNLNLLPSIVFLIVSPSPTQYAPPRSFFLVRVRYVSHRTSKRTSNTYARSWNVGQKVMGSTSASKERRIYTRSCEFVSCKLPQAASYVFNNYNEIDEHADSVRGEMVQRWCLVRWLLCAYALSHSEHANGLSPE